MKKWKTFVNTLVSPRTGSKMQEASSFKSDAAAANAGFPASLSEGQRDVDDNLLVPSGSGADDVMDEEFRQDVKVCDSRTASPHGHC